MRRALRIGTRWTKSKEKAIILTFRDFFASCCVTFRRTDAHFVESSGRPDFPQPSLHQRDTSNGSALASPQADGKPLFAGGSRNASAKMGTYMGVTSDMLVLEQQLKSYEEELARLRVENDQLRRSSQAFGELAERLSIALQTATRVNRRASAADATVRRRAIAES